MGKLQDLTGQKFGRLTVLKRVPSKDKNSRWLCECIDGNKVEVSANSLKGGQTKSCGCLKKEGKNITGQKFNMLTAIKYVEKRNKQHYWLFLCDCENETIASKGAVVHGGTKSCGCLKRKYYGKGYRVNLTGQRFGKLIAIKRLKGNKDSEVKWLCQCDCGKTKTVRHSNLKSKSTRSCGCLIKESNEKRMKDYTGTKKGKLTAVKRYSTHDNKTWLFKCDCGNEKIAQIKHVLSGNTSSCGCHTRSEEFIREREEKRKRKLENLIGQEFGKLKVVKLSEEKIHRSFAWECICDCGETILVRTNDLKKKRKRSCGCLLSPKIQHYVNENDCHICTSHTGHDSIPKIRRRILEEQMQTKIPLGITIRTACKNPKCINPNHMTSNKEMLVRVSNTFNRIGKITPNKRGSQVGMIKHIQQTAKDNLAGDWIQTPGPGNLALNYWVFERAFHPKSRYIAIEKDRTSSKLMTAEAFALKQRLKDQPWSNEVQVRTGEIFKYAKEYILSQRRVSVVDACLCITPSSMVKDGIIMNIRNLCSAHKITRKEMFISLTFSLRNSTQKDKNAISSINSTIESFNGKTIYDHNYRDGAPMRTITWHLED